VTASDDTHRNLAAVGDEHTLDGSHSAV
jgi:hypothetical protein